MNTIQKEKFLEENGWQRYGSRDWVKKEWLEEPEKLNREPHLCPNWYHVESLEDAVAIVREELAVAVIKKTNALENAKILERTILDAIRGSDWSDVRSAARGFAKKRLYHWYITECNSIGMKPNPDIIKDFGELGELA